jgi:sigma54-dependent transcription regulator
LRPALQQTSSNDADRLRKYLLRHGLSWDRLHAG